jgi:hypothetical protein
LSGKRSGSENARENTVPRASRGCPSEKNDQAGCSPSDGGSARMDLSPKKPAEIRREKRIWLAAPESLRASNPWTSQQSSTAYESPQATQADPRQRIFCFGISEGVDRDRRPICSANFGGATLGEIGVMSITREGRRVEALVEELNRMGRETSEPVPIATGSADLSAELRRGLSYVKKPKQARYQARNQGNVA